MADPSTPSQPPALDLPAYLARIGFRGPLQPTLGTLEALHVAHTSSIPFENLDIQLGRRVRLDLPALQAKLVHGHRGGYCFEHNSLFAAVLEAGGFTAIRREARVRRGASTTLSRTHLVLEVVLEGRSWLEDVGFGAEGIPGPVPMGGEMARYGLKHRVVPEGALQVLQVWEAGGWSDLYALEPGAALPVDLEVANHYTSTHPDSRFVQTLTAQWCRPGNPATLRNLTFSERRGAAMVTRELAREELLGVLADRFGLSFPPGTRFRALED